MFQNEENISFLRSKIVVLIGSSFGEAVTFFWNFESLRKNDFR